MLQETITTQMSATERFTESNELMARLGGRLVEHRDYQRVVARATLSVLPGEVAWLNEGPIIFRNRGNLQSFQHEVGADYRRMVLVSYEGKNGKPIKWTDRVVLSSHSFNGEADGYVHYHREVMRGEDPEPLNNSQEAIAEIRRVISQL